MNTTENVIRVSRKDKVGYLEFNRPDALNAISTELAEAFLAACRSMTSDPDVNVIVLTGAGSDFMAGGDLRSFYDDLDNAPDVASGLLQPLNEALLLLADARQPVLASVKGAVAGGGLSVALCCDLIIASEDTRFNVAYTRVGACLDASGSWFLPRLIGLHRAMELALLSETFGPERALELGIVNRVVPASDLQKETFELANRLARGPVFALGQVKKLLRASFSNSLREQLSREHDAFRSCARTKDFAEGVTAFITKRRPNFTGRY
jgi:2-(1,2-epoxy-1,2-dihydrophenyl)acetyl-CoA isomerase